MATYTSRLFATKPASSENVSITVLNDNFDLFDASVGTTVASAAAQPASAFSGRMWYETDTRELKINTAASASTAAVWSSGSSVKVWEPGLNLAGGTGGAAASDGTTDVTSVMQVKIDLLNAAGGGTLFIPERTYRVAMLRTYPFIRFQGTVSKQYGFTSTGVGSVLALPSSLPSAQLVSHIVVTAGGSAYSSAPTVSFTGGGGTGLAATAYVSASTVVAVEVTDPGSGYTSAPTVVFSGGSGTGAAADALRSCPIFYTRDGSAVFHSEWAGLTLRGNGTAGGIGILMHNTWAWKITDSHFYGFDREAIYNYDGAGGIISDCKIFGLSRTTGTTYKSGALRTKGSDTQLTNLEIGADDSTDSTNLWNAAWMHEGSSAMATNVICEGADVGLLLTGARNEFTNLRADINKGHGVWLTRVNTNREPPHRNIFSSVKSHHNGNYAHNTYDAFRIDSGHTIVENIITTLRTEGNDSSPQHRYGLYDGPNNTIMGGRIFHHHRSYAASGTTAGFLAGPGG